jgi:hypothetical protein
MEPWLINEIETLETRIAEMGSPEDLTREIQSIREEAARISNAAFLQGIMSPSILEADALKKRLERLRDKVNS